MKIAITLTWVIIRALHIVSLLLLLGGVALFGWHLIRAASPRSANHGDKLSPEIWRGKPAMLALKIFGAGVVLQLMSILLAIVVTSWP
jgi:hypothetical protein